MTDSIGVLHPGEMGAQVGACLKASGCSVLWAREARGDATAERARAAGLQGVASLAGLVTACERIISVCPPSAALDVAREVQSLGFRGTYVDANAIAPATVRAMAELFAGSPVDFVDGGIVGPPPVRPGLARLYLSGPCALAVTDWLAGSALETIVVDGPVGAASALKMAYAAWTKGTTALLAAVYSVAREEGVGPALLREWERSQPGLVDRLQGVPHVVRKAWRFEGEMHEIADTFSAAGLPEGFHRAAAEVYARFSESAGAGPDAGAPGLDELVDRLVRLPSQAKPTASPASGA